MASFKNDTQETYQYSAISSTTTVRTGAGALGGIFCSSSSSGTCTIYDGTSTGGTVIAAVFDLEAGKTYPFPIAVGAGIHIVIGGTAAITVLYI